MTTLTQAFAAPTRNVSFVRAAKTMLAAAQTRRQLKNLDAHLLEDIGVSYKDAVLESRRLVWDLR
ncbi:MAG: DUF1127 domain-containing protein [Halocynthiibacter sp.]